MATIEYDIQVAHSESKTLYLVVEFNTEDLEDWEVLESYPTREEATLRVEELRKKVVDKE